MDFETPLAPGSLRTALERHAKGLLDRVAPYQPFGWGPWAELTA